MGTGGGLSVQLVNIALQDLTPDLRYKWKQELIDSQNGEVLARYVDFSTGENQKFPGEPPIKFWL